MAEQKRRIIDAVDEVRVELRVANLIEVVKLGASALDESDEKSAANAKTRARMRRLNRARRQIKTLLSLDEEAR